MKNFILPFLTFIISIALHAQNVVISRPADAEYGTLSIQSSEENSGIFSADNFELTEETALGELDVYGYVEDGIDYSSLLVGINVYIYEDNSGVPAGNPSQSGTGVLELHNIDPSLFTLEANNDGEVNFKSIKIKEANGGSAVILPAGSYWLSVSAYATGSFSEQEYIKPWSWMGSTTENSAAQVQIIDPEDILEFGVTSWIPYSSTLGESFPTCAWELRDEAMSSIEDNIIEGFKMYPSLVDDILNLKATNDIINVSIYNLLGQKVLNTPETTINMSGLPSGTYIVKVNTTREEGSYKVIKK
ncbi:MAG: hypothetical protein CR968_03725 [Flavobacteriia bacterium]|nr:MAG: hypothetical protein CR968_03725 [Flavobacteriia bacterium]